MHNAAVFLISLLKHFLLTFLKISKKKTLKDTSTEEIKKMLIFYYSARRLIGLLWAESKVITLTE